MSQSSFLVKFQLSENEFCRAHRVHLRRSLLTGWNVLLLTIALALASAQAQVLGGAEWAGRFFLGLWALVVVLMGYGYFELPRRLFRRSARYSGEQTLAIDGDGVSLTTEGGKSYLGWEEISRAQETVGFFFIYSREKGALPILLPVRACGDDQTAEAVRGFLRKKLLGF